MRVFVAGATGAIGRRVVPLLIERGHDVTGMTRSPHKVPELEAIGAEPVVCDAYDRERLITAVRQSASEAIVHLLTDLPPRLKPRGDTESTDRLRREGTGNLVEAARRAGARRFVAQSIAFLYRPGGSSPKEEGDEAWFDAPGSFGATVRAILDLERQVLDRAPDGIILRLGWLYGPGTWFAPDGSVAQDVRRRRYPLVGSGAGQWSFVHVDDVATAVATVLERGRAGIYNIVDDEPAPMREWLPVFAHALDAPPPLRLPAWLARVLAGSATTELANRLAGASNLKAKAELGWTPAWASWRAGFHGASGGSPPHQTSPSRQSQVRSPARSSGTDTSIT